MMTQSNEELLKDVDQYKHMLSLLEEDEKNHWGWPVRAYVEQQYTLQSMIWNQIADKLLLIEQRNQRKLEYKR